MDLASLGLGLAGVAVPLAIVTLIIVLFAAMRMRQVVPTNETHTVQRGGRTVVYGIGQEAGNVYWRIPSGVPRWGVLVTVLPSSVFQIDLLKFNAYDKGRVPFVIDIVGFFHIVDPLIAASRIVTMDDFKSQLLNMLRDVMRAILASYDIEAILEERSTFGQRFTQEVDTQLQQWGVGSAKQIGLMKISDNVEERSEAISNIMRKKQSEIERESRVTVAKNMQDAANAETAAAQLVKMRQVEANQAVGQREAEQAREVGIAKQRADQMVKEQEAITAQRQMEVNRVNAVQHAEIERQQQLVTADQLRQMAVIQAEGQAASTVARAQGNLEGAKRDSEAVTVRGRADGEAQTAVQMAPVRAQIALAQEVGQNAGYQKYLIDKLTVEKDLEVGRATAEALKAAQIKIIANTATPMEGVKNVMQLLTPQGMTQVGAAIEALGQTDAGREIIDRVTNGGTTA